MIIYLWVQYLLLSVLGLATTYILIFSVAGLFYRQRKYKINAVIRKIAVLIPGYREDAVIVSVASAALRQRYPRDCFEVVVIADSFKKETLDALKLLPLKLIEVSFDKSTKSKALNTAMSQLSGSYDVAVVLDADNIMADDFLSKINSAFEHDYVAVQGHRTAKNVNNSWAILDAISEEINNHLFRKGHRVLGLSSAIIGSGMAFRYDYFKSIMAGVTAVGGFDKEIELKILKQGNKIAYLDDAMVYDEKIQQSEVFGNQRRRWLAAQVHYFRSGFPDASRSLIMKGNVDYFDKAIQFMQPPRVLLLGSLLLLGTFFTLINSLSGYGKNVTLYWLALIACCVVALLLAVPRMYYKWRTVKALAGLPKGMLLMMRSLLRIKGANKTFIHTSHNSTGINTRY